MLPDSDETQPFEDKAPRVDYRELIDRSQHNRRRSHLSLLLAALAIGLAVGALVSSALFFAQQNKLNNLVDRSDCRAVLAARQDAATAEFFSAVVSAPPDAPRVQRVIVLLNQISAARQKDDPCRALQQLPAKPPPPVGAPSAMPMTSTTATTQSLIVSRSAAPASGGSSPPTTITTSPNQKHCSLPDPTGGCLNK